jgi:hypothetical protein
MGGGLAGVRVVWLKAVMGAKQKMNDVGRPIEGMVDKGCLVMRACACRHDHEF